RAALPVPTRLPSLPLLFPSRPPGRVVVEVDGGRRRQARDAARDEVLEAKGYVVLRVDEAEVEERTVADRLRRALAG
ncbi:MAG: DUF559 domain-containing protein, partial [Thermoleophilaceae bacterium]